MFNNETEIEGSLPANVPSSVRDTTLFSWRHHEKDLDYAHRLCRVCKNIVLKYDNMHWSNCFKLRSIMQEYWRREIGEEQFIEAFKDNMMHYFANVSSQ